MTGLKSHSRQSGRTVLTQICLKAKPVYFLLQSRGSFKLPASYLVPSGEAAPSLVPRDLGMGQSGNQAVQIQGLPFSHMGGGRLDPD